MGKKKQVSRNKKQKINKDNHLTKKKGHEKSKNMKKENSDHSEISDIEESDFEIAEEGMAQERSKELADALSQEKDEEEISDTRKLVVKQNKKNKKSGGFQSMGLSHQVFKGVMKKGYKVPTPIQRKTIPLIMDNRDVVAMARTGSGKTAAFLIPMFEKLKVHSTKGVRALILSPTRELAIQTLKFTKELGKFTDLKTCLILGGDSMESQFASLHQNPDVIIASPGRLLHLLVEMEIKCLDCMEYVVFDEADRLFEMGFAEQLQEIIRRLPSSRQTVLFSATLPKVLVDFASAGLNDPELIRLDVDTKISERLKMSFFMMRPDDKVACLLHLLQTVIDSKQQTVVFVSTKHHVDYLQQLLQEAGVSSTYIYSSLDQTARKINIAKFRKKLSMVLLVTDIAARGIDIPMLDNVINYDFPSKPKIFVHRVGRVARAGQSGTAYSFLCKEEMSFYFDLHLFLGRPVKFATADTKKDEDGVLGSVPQEVLANEVDFIKNTTTVNFNLVSMHKVMMNGYKQYIRSRESPSAESIKRSKNVNISTIGQHPIFNTTGASNELSKLLTDLQKFKPNLTVFEAMNTKKSREQESIMKMKRLQHHSVIEQNKIKMKTEKKQIEEKETKEHLDTLADDSYIADAFSFKNKKGYKDDNYIPHQAADHHGEQWFNVKSFEKEAQNATLDLMSDDKDTVRKSSVAKKWDRKRKKFITTEGSKPKKIKTESGNYIPASYKSNKYSDWVKRNNFSTNRHDDDDENHDGDNKILIYKKKMKGKSLNNKINFKSNKKSKGTLKTKDQMVKGRMKASQQKFFQKNKGGGGGGGRAGKRKR